MFIDIVNTSSTDGAPASPPPRHHGRRAIIIFVGLVMHFHGVYGLLAIVNDYVLPLAVSISVVIIAVGIMTVDNTLGNILAFEMDASDEVIRKGFCCGAFDYHLKYFFGQKCFVTACNRRFYFARLFYYNMNAFLIAAAWFGVDVNRSIMTERIVGASLEGRVWMDIFYLVLSNMVLVLFHELMGQFGVVGDQAVLQYADEAKPATMEPDEEPAYSPTVAQAIPSPTTKTNTRHSNSDGMLHLQSTLQTKLITSPAPSPSARMRPTLSRKEDIIIRLKIVLAFFALTMFWTATWDLFCSIPSEVMVGSEDDDGADDDYYDVHVKGHSDDEFQLLFLGLGYTIVALVYMIVTGELFSVVKRQDNRSETIRLYFQDKLSCTLPKENAQWTLGNLKFFPVRLISHNIKGAMSVIGWAGVSMVLSSIERNIIYDIEYNLERRIVTELAWLLLANVILVATNDFGLQYGGSDHLSARHEVVSIDVGELPPGTTVFDIEENKIFSHRLERKRDFDIS